MLCFAFVEEFELQPALINVFHRRDSDEVTAKETMQEVEWQTHYSEYGKYDYS